MPSFSTVSWRPSFEKAPCVHLASTIPMGMGPIDPGSTSSTIDAVPRKAQIGERIIDESSAMTAVLRASQFL
jgi:hypothetical protein